MSDVCLLFPFLPRSVYIFTVVRVFGRDCIRQQDAILPVFSLPMDSLGWSPGSPEALLCFMLEFNALVVYIVSCCSCLTRITRPTESNFILGVPRNQGNSNAKMG